MKKIVFGNKIYLKESASTAGKLESEGPLSELFDSTDKDSYFGTETWEQAEAEMVRRTVNILLAKAKLKAEDIDIMLGGDLLNQCTATGFAAQDFPVSYIGLYGACSTAAEAMILGSTFIESGHAARAVALASSHFCSSERQYRFPLEYGSQRTPVSQNTVTGCGAFLLSTEESPVRLTKALVGRVMENGITDANNMGAAMTFAAVDTISRFFEDENPADYDIIATGDLGREGFELASEQFKRKGIDLKGKYTDCGMLIYDYDKQDVNSGGSGCGCSACVTASLFRSKLLSGEAKKIALIGTGALLSPKTVLQKQPIPAVAHLICMERTDLA